MTYLKKIIVDIVWHISFVQMPGNDVVTFYFRVVRDWNLSNLYIEDNTYGDDQHRNFFCYSKGAWFDHLKVDFIVLTTISFLAVDSQKVMKLINQHTVLHHRRFGS